MRAYARERAMTQFDIARGKAGMNVAAHDEYVIHLLKHALNPNVV